MVVRYLAMLSVSDKRTVLGRTMSKILHDCNLTEDHLFTINPATVKRTLTYWPADEKLQCMNYLGRELLDARENKLTIPGFTNHEINELLHYVCTS